MNCDYNCNGYVNNPFGCGGCNTCGYTPIMGGFGCNNTGCSLVCNCFSCFLIINHLW